MIISPIHGAKKVGIIGTNSAGKSTMAYEVLWRLKKAGVIADGVIQQDRRMGFKQEYLDTNVLAQYSLISRQMMVEADMCMGDGVEMIVTDRTPFDLYAYYHHVFGGNEHLLATLYDWLSTYERIYFLNPVAYEATPARQPTESFRDAVHKTMKNLVDRYRNLRGGKNVHTEPLDPVQSKLWRLGLPHAVITLAGADRKLCEATLKIIPGTLKQDVLIGGSYARGFAHAKSDLDLHVLDINSAKEKVGVLSKVLKVDIELISVPNANVWVYLRDECNFKELVYES